MGRLFINLEKEYQVQWKSKNLNRTNIDYLETSEDAEEVYLKRLNNPNVSYVEMLECKPIKAYRK